MAREPTVQGFADASGPGLSQLAARVLNQLAVSAWLPAATLILMVSFILRLGEQVQNQPADTTLTTALADALSGYNDVSLGGIVILSILIVVSTMLTQAFSFDLIRVLEGYWGSNWKLEALADRRCNAHRWKRMRLEHRLEWERRQAERDTGELIRYWLDCEPNRLPQDWKPSLAAVKADLMRGQSVNLRSLTRREKRQLREMDSRALVPNSSTRRLRNLENRLSDYPVAVNRTMPTSLGNVLRSYEDRTGRLDIQGMVDRVFHLLPGSLQASYDEQRGRLDLYGSLFFVWGLSCLFGVTRLITAGSAGLAIGFGCVLVVGCLLTYRATISTARYYGALLLEVSQYDR